MSEEAIVEDAARDAALRERTGSGRDPDAAAPEEDGLRFDDPYWDDAFCAWWDPALRTCC